MAEEIVPEPLGDYAEPREAMEYDVVIVGAGPAGLSAAIKIKQLAEAAGAEISVAVLEKGSEVGAHILSGAVIDPVGIKALFPDWQARGCPLDTPVKEDKFLFLGHSGELDISWLPMPKFMKNHGNYIGFAWRTSAAGWAPRRKVVGRGDLPRFRRLRARDGRRWRGEGRGRGRRRHRQGRRAGRRTTRPGIELRGTLHASWPRACGVRSPRSCRAKYNLCERCSRFRSTASASRSCGRCRPTSSPTGLRSTHLRLAA